MLGGSSALVLALDLGTRLPLAVLAGAPALLVLVALDRFDARRSEPRWLLRRAAILGGAVVLPVLAFELLLALAGMPVRGADAWSIALSSTLVVALPEEAGKAAVLLWLLARRLELEDRRDGMRYGARIGLGFAIVENAWYGLALGDSGSFALLVAARTLSTVPMHAICGALIGDDIGRRRIDGTGAGAFGGIAAAVGVHALFDFGLGVAGLADARGDRSGFALAVVLALAALAIGMLALRRRALVAAVKDAEDEHAAAG